MFSQGRFESRVVFVGGEFVKLFGVLPISAKSVCRNFGCFVFWFWFCFWFLASVTFTSMLAANLFLYSPCTNVQNKTCHGRLMLKCISIAKMGYVVRVTAETEFTKSIPITAQFTVDHKKALSLRVCAHCLVHVHAVVDVQRPQKAFRCLLINTWISLHCMQY